MTLHIDTWWLPMHEHAHHMCAQPRAHKLPPAQGIKLPHVHHLFRLFCCVRSSPFFLGYVILRLDNASSMKAPLIS